jgi:serpin B
MGILGLLVLAVGGLEAERPRVDADTAEVVRGNSAFALELYGRLRGREGNLFLSPASISTALAMTYGGARGRTADAMASTLHFGLGPDRLHSALGALLRDLGDKARRHGYTLNLADALWTQKGHPFVPEFLRLAHDRYGAELRELEFSRAAGDARRTINDWVARQTNDKIRDLIQEGMLDPDTRLVLTNAIYFKGDWAHPFPKDRTQDAPFHLSTRTQTTGPLMSQTNHFGYLEGKSFQAVELPYAGSDLAMVVLLPRQVDGLADTEKSLTRDTLQRCLDGLQEREVAVSLPRFRVTAEFSLKDTLAAMGMGVAFSGDADFSGMDGTRDLYLSAVVHKAYVDVNEKGTEAAAATGVVAKLTEAPVIPVFRADHPFLFLIRDRRTGSVLFMGRLVNPRT